MSFPIHHPDIKPTHEGTFENEKYAFFWNGVYSNWHPANFTINYQGYPIPFNCAEQAMMLAKAVMFGDEYIAEKVMSTSSPREQKAYGRQVAGFDMVKWQRECIHIITEVLVQKFAQNPHMLKILLDTGNKTIVEASPFDVVWGIGMGVNDKDLLNKKLWKGTNFLGICLMNAREQLNAS